MRLKVLSFSLPFHLSLAMALVVLAGCGLKPATLTPPPPAKKTDFPRVYPDPSTDPKPVPHEESQPATPQPESPQQP